jgi:CRISPR-associated protein Csh2
MTDIARRSEFLFLYDTKMANPNGDPDENRPRIDLYSGRNLVTEYRLKRTIRDYLRSRGENIFMREDLNEDGSRKTIEELAEPYIKGEKKEKTVDKEKLINEHIDVRLFGLLFAVKGVTFKSIGPVQFSIGQSLNKVQDILIRNTRVVPTREGAESGTFGEKTILKYSLLAFHGFLNQHPAKQLNLTEKDVIEMMLAMWHGTNDLSTSSKFGQASRFLLRIIYSDEVAYIGDIDRAISLNNMENVEDISQTSIEFSKLFSMLTQYIEKISEIQFGCHDNLIPANETQNLKALILKWAEDNHVKYQDILSIGDVFQ